jgi:hypothetical protein
MTRVILRAALVALMTIVAVPHLAIAQPASGPVAHYAASWHAPTIFYRHASWGNLSANPTYPPYSAYCVHPDYRPGTVLRVTTPVGERTCLIFDMVQTAHQAQWRARWALEVDWTTWVAWGLASNNWVSVHGPVSTGGNVAQSTPESPPEPCRHFDVTGYSLCHGFKAYWEEMGGLAIFGYPLTNEFDEDGLTIQVFERAVFEYHDGTVMLRRLGAEFLADE